ncbi:8029_t:CDS:10 [Paraglomus occultum]|uniref:8029_t:CDS:1 n=1 Tax=Paraglomus occultum TaxID=144539 RepID=A0A9N8YYU5_9GLOM|nr:8029_t:CDS:10 [Paraglomus occultum]
MEMSLENIITYPHSHDIPERIKFPKTLEEFGYYFNERGELRNTVTDERFLFDVRKNDPAYNQARYDALGEIVSQYVEDLLVTKYGFIQQFVPVEAAYDQTIPHCPIYLSANAYTCKKLILLIQGSGGVRPGQWSRQVIINDSLKLGSMFPYIEQAQERNFGIIIFNPNVNSVTIHNSNGCDERQSIKNSATPVEHCLYVWKNFVSRATTAEDIVIIAHSLGGLCATYLLKDLAEEFCNRIKAIALTDSAHNIAVIPEFLRLWFSRVTINWVISPEPLDTPVPDAANYGCPCLSAGHVKHEYTSGSAFPAIFKFISHMFSVPVPIRLSKSVKTPIISNATVGHTARLGDNIAIENTARQIEIIEIEDSDGEIQNDALFIERRMRKVHIEARSTSAVIGSIDIDSPEDRTINTIMESINLDPPEANEALSTIFNPPEADEFSSIIFDPPGANEISSIIFDPPEANEISSIILDPPGANEISSIILDPPGANEISSIILDPPGANEISSIILDPPGANEISSIILDPPGANEISSLTYHDIIDSDEEYTTEVAYATQPVPSTSLNEPVQSTSPTAPVPSTSLNASVQSTSLNASVQSTSLNAITEDEPQVQPRGFFQNLFNTLSSVKSVFSLGWFNRTQTGNEPSLNEAPQMTERERAKATAQMAPLQPRRLNASERKAARRTR